MTRPNSPNVSKIAGRVSITTKGLISAFTMENISEANIRTRIRSPYCIPVTMEAVVQRPKKFTNQRSANCFIPNSITFLHLPADTKRLIRAFTGLVAIRRLELLWPGQLRLLARLGRPL